MLGTRQRLAIALAFGLGLTLALLLQLPRQRQRGAPGPVSGLTESNPLLEMSASLPRSPHEQALIASAAKYNLDPFLVHAVIEAESGFDPGVVSAKGALGLMQVLPDTAALVGLPEPADAAGNLEAGCRYLAGLLAEFGGDAELALAAYNAGPGAVRRWGGMPPYRETREFVRRVSSRYRSRTGLDVQVTTRVMREGSALF